MKYELPQLKYHYDALEPHIDAATMEIHHTRHHAAYTNNLNAALEDHEALSNMDIETLLQSLDQVPESIYWAVRNNGGGYYNHSLFWNIMSPQGGGEPNGQLGADIQKTFGSFEKFKELFNKAAATRFGSGWAWLILNKDHELEVVSTANQDSPIMEGNKVLLGLDVWEHAYYLKYQNKRPDYINAWWNVVDWDYIEERYNSFR
ncbi:Fe-Mn family superoxide dismutase [Anaerosolibacter carboniphilus]|uniref:Superoxide dismutase n=1 Tax=Anaerosolibacter carboniphilus TaxID=1417629 RepID=A0A841KVZ8_9FIRM|nr:superoxide dismutase [Anaerosolibacter carboniphilus]MBB6214359.1 Fe-Mn family superoxide dismutase [Anaerosolibacter carboniphilus]